MRLSERFSALLGTAITAAASTVGAVPITSPSAFTVSDTLVAFDHLPASLGGGIPASNTPLTTQYASSGVRFSAEDVPGALQTTDAADAAGRFGSTWFFYAAQSGGGVPKSGTRYAGGQYASKPTNMSDMRIDFTVPVSAFGMWIIDNDFSVGRLQAFDALGTLLETVVVPQVGEGGSSFRGIDVGADGTSIAYAILDGNHGAALDSTFVDNLYFRVSSIPEPETWALMVGGIALLSVFKRRR